MFNQPNISAFFFFFFFGVLFKTKARQPAETLRQNRSRREVSTRFWDQPVGMGLDWHTQLFLPSAPPLPYWDKAVVPLKLSEPGRCTAAGFKNAITAASVNSTTIS